MSEYVPARRPPVYAGNESRGSFASPSFRPGPCPQPRVILVASSNIEARASRPASFPKSHNTTSSILIRTVNGVENPPAGKIANCQHLITHRLAGRVTSVPLGHLHTRPFGLISLKGPANTRPRPSQEAKLVANKQHRSFSEWGLVPPWKDLASVSAGPMDGLFLLGGKGEKESEECSGSLRLGCL